MPMVPTFISGEGGFGGLLRGGLDLIGDIFGRGQSGGFGLGRSLFPERGEQPMNIPLTGQALVAQGATCISPRASTSLRLPATVHVPTTDAAGNTKITTYKNMGRCLLYSGDLAAAKRVRRVAGKARRSGGR